MHLLEFKEAISRLNEIHFYTESGTEVPSHFHITEIGQIDKRYIDCGGAVRIESKVSIQLWNSVDTDHRLRPEKLLKIIEISESKLAIGNHEIEVEYQDETIGKFGLEFNGTQFVLKTKKTDCLAIDACGIPVEKTKLNLCSLVQESASCCDPKSGCC